VGKLAEDTLCDKALQICHSDIDAARLRNIIPAQKYGNLQLDTAKQTNTAAYLGAVG
jgi:hypothetical protein